MSYVKELKKAEAITPPRFVYDQLHYEVIMGSFAYGVSSDTSDLDVYGFCVPPKSIVFPHTTGKYIFGYDPVKGNFEQWTEHHIKHKNKEYDFTIYNIVKYFRLCADGNPNMVDSLFVPNRCVTHITQMGNLVRENRRLFLTKKCWHTFKGYAFSMLNKARNKIKAEEITSIRRFEAEHDLGHEITFDEVEKEMKRRTTISTLKNLTNEELKTYYLLYKKGLNKTKRFESQKIHNTDLKFLYHLVRLLGEVEQILLEGDLDLERNREQLKAIRRGDWTKERVEDYFETKEKDLESLYLKSNLPHGPDRDKIRDLLFECLEMHGYKDVMIKELNCGDLLNDIEDVLSKYR